MNQLDALNQYSTFNLTHWMNKSRISASEVSKSGCNVQKRFLNKDITHKIASEFIVYTLNNPNGKRAWLQTISDSFIMFIIANHLKYVFGTRHPIENYVWLRVIWWRLHAILCHGIPPPLVVHVLQYCTLPILNPIQLAWIFLLEHELEELAKVSKRSEHIAKPTREPGASVAKAFTKNV